jgi:hypothetical protein
MKYTIEFEVDPIERIMKMNPLDANGNVVIAMSLKQTVVILTQGLNDAKKKGAKTKDLAPLIKSLYVLNKWLNFYQDVAFQTVAMEMQLREDTTIQQGELPNHHEEAGPFPDVKSMMKIVPPNEEV